MRGIIYVITNTINDKIYIGQTKDSLETRFKRHKNNTGAVYLRNAFNKHGFENFNIEYVEHYDTDDVSKLQDWLDETEIAYIRLFDTTNPTIGYNITKGGRGSLGVKHSDETKQKMSESQKARWTDATKLLLSELYSKKVYQYTLDGTFIRMFDSATKASDALNIARGAICLCCNGNSKTSGGFIWKYHKE